MSNSLQSAHPELVPEWSEKNLPLTPDQITYGSNKIVWWKAACGHEWQTSVKARSNGEKCTICSGARIVAGINDLATLRPQLAKEWSERNELKARLNNIISSFFSQETALSAIPKFPLSILTNIPLFHWFSIGIHYFSNRSNPTVLLYFSLES